MTRQGLSMKKTAFLRCLSMSNTTRIAVLFVLISCTFLSPRLCAASEGSVLDRIGKATVPNTPAIESVQPITEETVVAKERYQGGTFKVLARKKFIERYRCSSCHNTAKVLAGDGEALTHGSIAINHGKEGSGLTCVDCHHRDDKDFLEDKKGQKIDFDHSYLLCGQCHFRQKRDWLGGAHGKRVTYWAGERVVRNCTTCHNPHAPRFPKRFPATYSVPTD
jgi:hypothetical protein